MPKRGVRMDEELRAAIIEDIRAGKKRNEIARERGVSPGSVSNIAKSEGLHFDRSATKAATEARLADIASRRSMISQRLIQLAEMSMEQALAELDGASAKEAAVVLGISVDKAIALERHSQANESNAAVDAWLNGMTGL